MSEDLSDVRQNYNDTEVDSSETTGGKAVSRLSGEAAAEEQRVISEAIGNLYCFGRRNVR